VINGRINLKYTLVLWGSGGLQGMTFVQIFDKTD